MNPLSQLRRVAFTLTAVLLSSSALQADTKIEFLDLLRALKVAPNTEAIATRQGYVLQGIQVGADDAKPQVGDTITALVHLGSFDGKPRPSQWIIRLQLTAKISTESPQRKPRDATLYTNTGEKFTFHSEQTGMKLETLGPIKVDTKPDQSLQIKYCEIFAATDYLGLNLYHTAQVFPRIRGSHLTLEAGPKPFPADDVNVQQPRAAALNLTTDDLRSFSGVVPALEQFLAIVRNTPDLQDILFQILDKPSLIDVFRHGANSSLSFDLLGGGHSDGQEIFWPDTKHEDFGCLHFNLVLFKKPILTVALYVTTPRPPLLTSAGILGIFAWSPSKLNKIVAVRVLSATAGVEPIPPSPSAVPIPFPPAAARK
ncbi:MAG: hypothetical protein WC378_06935 [Opitutaceae bacterium]|jgi:hypothetical protein